MITGKDKGKTGKIARAFPAKDMVLISGVNIKKKHQRANKTTQKGQILDVASPIHISNVMIVDDGKRGRIGKRLSGEKYIRFNKKTGKAV